MPDQNVSSMPGTASRARASSDSRYWKNLRGETPTGGSRRWWCVVIAMSVGIATVRPDDADTDRRADRALYRAKSAGRDRVEVRAPGDSQRPAE